MQIDPNKMGGLKPDDVEGALQKILAPGYVTNIDQFVSMLKKDRKFKPHGILAQTFTTVNRECLLIIPIIL